jgi:hypothetical protein
MRLDVLLSACTALLLVLPHANTYSDVPESAIEKIIDSYVRAVGGSAISSIRSETSTGTMTRGLSGAVPLETFAKSPGKWRYNQIFAWGDRVNFGFDGADGWIADTAGFEPMAPSQQIDLQLILDFQAPLKLREWFPTMEIAGTDTIGDSVADVISARSRDGLATELAFDRASGYLVRAGGIRFGNYRAVGDVIRPFRIDLGTHLKGDHIPMKIEFTEIRHNLDIDDTIFQQPGCVLRAEASPVYKPRAQIDLDIPSLDACVGTYLHPTDSNQNLIVSRQGNHLMIRRSSGGMEIEIKPESATDFSIWFLRREFHFLKDSLGVVAYLVPGADTTRKFIKAK